MVFTTCIIIVIMIIMIWRHMANVEIDQIWSPEKRWSALRLKLCVIGDVVFNHMLVPSDFETTGRAWGMSCRFWKLPSWDLTNISHLMEEENHHRDPATFKWDMLSVPRNGCFQKWWYPTTMGFPTKKDHFGVGNGGTPIFGNTQMFKGALKGR